MDWYGSYPPPSREEAALEVLHAVQKIRSGDHLSLCKQVIDAMPSLGSYTGWHVSFKKDAIFAVLAKFNSLEQSHVVTE